MLWCHVLLLLAVAVPSPFPGIPGSLNSRQKRRPLRDALDLQKNPDESRSFFPEGNRDRKEWIRSRLGYRCPSRFKTRQLAFQGGRRKKTG